MGCRVNRADLCALGICLTGLGVGWAPVASAQQPAGAVQSTFVAGVCDFTRVPPPVQARLRCGTVAVPRDYRDPGGATYALAVMVVKSGRQKPSQDPLLILPGGPGGSLMLPVAAAAASPEFFPDQDVILFDTRGSGLSQPRDVCPNVGLLSYAALDENAEALVGRARRSMSACIAAARRAGLSPVWYGTSVTVEDIERIRRALGVTRWSAIGASYGTVIGAALAARYPQFLRSLVLDSVVSPGDSRPLMLSRHFERSLYGVFAACEGDPACAAKYPDLDRQWTSALQQLDRKPITIEMPAGRSGRKSPFVLNRGDLEFLVFSALYARLGDVPALIHTACERRGDSITPALLQTEAPSIDLSMFGFLSVICRDDPPPPPTNGSGATGRADGGTSVPYAGYQVASPGDVCSAWTEPGPRPKVPRDTTVPTLILQGELDPVTAPIGGLSLARVMGPKALFVQIPAAGHAISHQNPCADSITTAFIRDPGKRPDLSCVARPVPISFK